MNSNKLQYTPDGQHPEDAIYEVKNFINKLQKVQTDYFDKLTEDLQITDEGESWLFDYIYNASEDEKHLTFDEYLSFYDKSLIQLVKYNE